MATFVTWAKNIALVIAIVVGTGVILAIVTPFKIEFAPRTIRFPPRTRSGKYLAGALAVLLTAIGVIVAYPFTPTPAKPSKHHRTFVPVVNINVPQPASPGNPLPLVKCIQSFQGSASLTGNQTLLIGNADAGTDNYFYVPVRWTTDHRDWVAKVYFGTGNAQTSHRFLVIAAVMSKDLADYLVAAYNHQHNAYLAVPNLPPRPIYVAKYEKVRRAKC